MESVIQKIRTNRDGNNMKQTLPFFTDTVIDGCQVKIHFDAVGDSKIITSIRSMLISAHMDFAFSSPNGGE